MKKKKNYSAASCAVFRRELALISWTKKNTLGRRSKIGGTKRGHNGIERPNEEKVTKSGSSTKIVNQFTESFLKGEGDMQISEKISCGPRFGGHSGILRTNVKQDRVGLCITKTVKVLPESNKYTTENLRTAWKVRITK